MVVIAFALLDLESSRVAAIAPALVASDVQRIELAN